jgi:hypothetical protein
LVNPGGLGEQAINKMAEIAIASQLDEAEDLEVKVKTDPGQLAQGELESLEIAGEGLVMQKDLRMEEMDITINGVAVSPMQALFGNLQLKKPTEGTAKILLTEADLNRAFNADILRGQMEQLQVSVQGESVTLDIQHIRISLLPNGKVGIDADVFQTPPQAQKSVSFTTTPKVSDNGRKVLLEQVEYAEGKELSEDLTAALLDQAKEILSLENFEMEGIHLHIHQLEVTQGKMYLQASADVTQLPQE